MKDRSEVYYRTCKRKGVKAAQEQIEKDVRAKVIINDYSPLYLTMSQEGYFK
tara:strand:+ start:25314 stop:25469 length:156 start_codon:yes stop_codon:yes gene_type:complete